MLLIMRESPMQLIDARQINRESSLDLWLFMTLQAAWLCDMVKTGR
jgi:hypothetical protein